VAAIPRGTNIFKLDTIGVTGRVESLPEVRRADVVRELPNRVVISVEERRPFTLVHGGRLHWMDEEGRLLGASPEAVAPPMPVISGLSGDELASMRTAPGPRARAAIGGPCRGRLAFSPSEAPSQRGCQNVICQLHRPQFPDSPGALY